MIWDYVGTAGIVAMEGSYVPQILRLFRTKRAADVSVLFPALNLLGRLLALVVFVVTHQQVFIVGFLVGATLRAVLLCQVVYFRANPRGYAPSIAPVASPS